MNDPAEDALPDHTTLPDMALKWTWTAELPGAVLKFVPVPVIVSPAVKGPGSGSEIVEMFVHANATAPVTARAAPVTAAATTPGM